jgi:hypothetical protein
MHRAKQSEIGTLFARRLGIMAGDNEYYGYYRDYGGSPSIPSIPSILRLPITTERCSQVGYYGFL